MLTIPCLALLVAACETTPPRTYPKFEDTSPPTFPDTSDTGNDTDTSDTGSETADLVQVSFSARVATVTGVPFGLDDAVRDTNATGVFAYDRNTDDLFPADDDRGTYDHRSGNAPFTLEVGGVTISGSGNPVVEIELASDTFRWSDGPQPGDTGVDRTCALDGVDDPGIGIELAFTPTGGDDPFPTDALPAIFPFAALDLEDVAVTFLLEDGLDGALTLEIRSFVGN